MTGESQATSANAHLREERERIRQFLEHRGVHDVRVFGSVARGDDSDSSDIDLLVEVPDQGSVGAELLTVLGLSEELSELLGIRVHVATPGTLSSRSRERALAEAVPL